MIINISKIQEIEKHIDNNTLIAFDLDNTLITSTTYHGSIKWESDLIEGFMKNGLSKEEAYSQACTIWKKAQIETKIKLIEEEAPILIDNWKKTTHVIGLTARDLDLKEQTYNGLNINNLIFSSFKGHEIEQFHNGVLFCSGINQKSKALINFMNKAFINSKPKNILVIDDLKSNLEEILNSSLKNEFKIKCFHYLNEKF